MKTLKNIATLSIFLAIFSTSFSQEFVKENELNVTAKSFEIDNLGNIYLVFDYNVYKLSPKGDTIAVYSAKNHGTISQLDVSIPQKPLILFKESGRFLELDFTLTENTVSAMLFQKGIMRPQLLRHAFNNGGYWLYDAAKFELINLDKNVNVTTKTGNLQLLTSLVDFKPTQLWIYNDHIYLADKKNGILIFDVFGTFIKKFHLNNFNEVMSLNDGFVFQNAEGIYYTSLMEQFKIETISLPENHIQTKFVDNKIYFLSTKSITIYSPKSGKNK
ncbi:MAG: hypothetical protein ACLGGV_06590 [Bacteroidia bacterium]